MVFDKAGLVQFRDLCIRIGICLQNEIPFTEEECTSSGEGCKGTCPKCDSALRFITMKLAERKKAGLPIIMEEARKAYRSSLR